MNDTVSWTKFVTKLRNDCNDSKKWSHGKLRDKMLQSTEWGNCCNKIKNVSVWSLTTTWVQDTYITILSISGGSALLRGDVGLRVPHGCLQLWSSIQLHCSHICFKFFKNVRIKFWKMGFSSPIISWVLLRYMAKIWPLAYVFVP